VSNTDEKEKQSSRLEDSLTEHPSELLKKELVPEAAPLMEELPSKEASPFLSALSPKAPEVAAPRPTPNYATPQRKTVFFGTSEIAALEEEFKAVSSPKPPTIPSQRVEARPLYSPLSPLSPPLPPAPPAAEIFMRSATTENTNPNVLGIPSENLLSTEDHGDIADPSETLSALLDEVFSEDVPDFEALFHSQSPLAPSSLAPAPAARLGAPPSPEKPPAPAFPQAPPWDPIATLVAQKAQASTTPADKPPIQPPAQPPAPEFVIPGIRNTPMPEPSVALFDEPTEIHMEELLTTTQTEMLSETSSAPPEPLVGPDEAQAASLLQQAFASSLATPQESETAPLFSEMDRLELNTDEMVSELQRTLEQASLSVETTAEPPEAEALQKLSALLETHAPPLSLAEKEEAAMRAAQPIFQLSSPPSFVEPTSRPAPAMAPIFHPLEKTHEAVPPPLFRLLGAFTTDVVLLCLAALGMLWAANATADPKQSTLSWLSNAASWKILGPTTLALLALLVVAYATFFAIAWNGASPGRKLLGLRLVDKEGQPVGFLKAFFRGLFSLLSFGLALSGFWWALIDKRRQTFHDKCTGTFVVHVQPKP